MQNTLGISIRNYFLLTVCFYFEFSKSFSLKRSDFIEKFEKTKNPWHKEEFHKLCKILSLDIKDIRYNKYFNCSDDALLLFYNNGTHVMRPLLCDDNDIYCPIPIYILNSCIEGLQFHVDLKNNTILNKELAHNLEDYIGEQLSYYSDKKTLLTKRRYNILKKGKLLIG